MPTCHCREHSENSWGTFRERSGNMRSVVNKSTTVHEVFQSSPRDGPSGGLAVPPAAMSKRDIYPILALVTITGVGVSTPKQT